MKNPEKNQDHHPACPDERWPEDRIDRIAQSDGSGDHYAKRELNPAGSSLTHSQAREAAEETGMCSDGSPCGAPSEPGDDLYCPGCPNRPQSESHYESWWTAKTCTGCGRRTAAKVSNDKPMCPECVTNDEVVYATPSRVTAQHDAISPDHYKVGGIETIDYMRAKSTPEEYKGHLRLTALKYLSRVGHKDEALQEYKKARWYLDRLIQELEQ